MGFKNSDISELISNHQARVQHEKDMDLKELQYAAELADEYYEKLALFLDPKKEFSEKQRAEKAYTFVLRHLRDTMKNMYRGAGGEYPSEENPFTKLGFYSFEKKEGSPILGLPIFTEKGYEVAKGFFSIRKYKEPGWIKIAKNPA